MTNDSNASKIVQDAHRRHGRIAAAAIRMDDGSVFTLPPPARHDDIARYFRLLPNYEQNGFVTDRGQWVIRQPALRIASQAGQIVRGPMAPMRGLFTEDLW